NTNAAAVMIGEFFVAQLNSGLPSGNHSVAGNCPVPAAHRAPRKPGIALGRIDHVQEEQQEEQEEEGPQVPGRRGGAELWHWPFQGGARRRARYLDAAKLSAIISARNDLVKLPRIALRSESP